MNAEDAQLQAALQSPPAPAKRIPRSLWAMRKRTDRERLIGVIQICEQYGWKEVAEHAGWQLWLLETGRIERAF